MCSFPFFMYIMLHVSDMKQTQTPMTHNLIAFMQHFYIFANRIRIKPIN